MTATFDLLGIDWVLGGSLASTYYSEPRTTIDADVAIVASGDRLRELVTKLQERFYVPDSAATVPTSGAGSFNVIDPERAFKVDVFVLGQGILDRNQIARRRNVTIPGFPGLCWVTAPEDVVLRKLTWWRESGGSDRQWRDIVQVLRHVRQLDHAYLRATALSLDLAADLDAALEQAGLSPNA